MLMRAKMLWVFVLLVWTLVVLTSPNVHAQTAASAPASAPSGYRCAPKTNLSRDACGTPYREVVSPEGSCEVWWSPDQGGWNIERRCCLTKYCKIAEFDYESALKRVATHASGVIVGMNEEVLRWGRAPANDQERYEYALLRWKACEDARVNVALMITPAASVPSLLAPAASAPGWCGAQPLPPVVAPVLDKYVVAKASGTATTRTAYLYVGGKRTATDGQAVVGAAVSAPVIAESLLGVSLTYCIVSAAALVNTTNTAPHVTSCTKAP